MKINRRLVMSSIKITSVLVLALSIMAGGCMAREIKVNVVVFNYTPTPLGEMTVQGRYVGGYFQKYGPGGTGGGIFCCIDVRPGEAEVKWTYGGVEGAPKAGTQASSAGEIPNPSGGHKYLGVHIYPDERIEFTLTRDIPSEKEEGKP